MKKYAVVIGNGRFPNEPDKKTWADLKCPKNDIDGLAKLLVNPEKGNFSPENVNVLLDKTSGEIIAAIEEVFYKATKDDLILIYYSGHGVQAGDSPAKLYLSAYNTVFNRPVSTAVSIAQLRELMDIKVSHKKIILILDCCYSGDAGSNFACKGSMDGELAQQLAEQAKGIYLLAAAGSTVAWEREYYSLFTKYLIEGLETGDADSNGDGHIDIKELFDYIRPRVEKEYPKQQPRLYGIAETGGKLIIAKSGLDSRKDRAEKISVQLYRLAQEKRISHDILNAAITIIEKPVQQLSEQEKIKDALISELLENNNAVSFIRAWDKLATDKTNTGGDTGKKSPKGKAILTISSMAVVFLLMGIGGWKFISTDKPPIQVNIEPTPATRPKLIEPKQELEQRQTFNTVNASGGIADNVIYNTSETKPTPEQQLKQAQAWLEGDDVKKYSLAVKLLQPLVNEGNTKAINLLASSYFFGLGVKKDEAHGCQLYKKAIDANNTDEKGFYDEKCVKS